MCYLKDIFKSVWISIFFEFCILQFADWVDLGQIVFSFVMNDLIYKEWWGRGGVLIPSESFALVLKVFVMLINEVQATTEFWCIIYVNACLSLVDFIFSQKSEKRKNARGSLCYAHFFTEGLVLVQTSLSVKSCTSSKCNSMVVELKCECTVIVAQYDVILF